MTRITIRTLAILAAAGATFLSSAPVASADQISLIACYNGYFGCMSAVGDHDLCTRDLNACIANTLLSY
jgi:hypothetical protein